ncbi:MAG: efflux RND transporter periplasmic adaptor subunit [Pseudomonadota bacterium]
MSTSKNGADASETPSWLWILVGGIALALGLSVFLMSTVAGASSRPAGDATTTDASPLVEVATVRVSASDYAVSAPGRLQPRQTLQIVGEVPGKVVFLNPGLEVGGRLEQGDVLFRVDQSDYIAAVNQAEAALASAEANLGRARADQARQAELTEKGFASESVLDSAVASLASASASVDQAKSQLSVARQNLRRTTVRAPFPAIVLSEQLAPDTYVAPGAPVAHLLDASAGEIVAGLSPADLAAVREARSMLDEGAELRVLATPNEGSLGSRPLEGYLDSFAPEIDPASRTVAIRAIFPDAFSAENEGHVFSGDFMTVEMAGVSGQSMYDIPTAAIRRNTAIWVVLSDNHIQLAEITPLEMGAETSLVTSDVDLEGKTVMVTALPEEVDGMRVRIAGDLVSGQ